MGGASPWPHLRAPLHSIWCHADTTHTRTLALDPGPFAGPSPDGGGGGHGPPYSSRPTTRARAT